MIMIQKLNAMNGLKPSIRFSPMTKNGSPVSRNFAVIAS